MASSCSTGYYGHLPRAKKVNVKKELKQEPIEEKQTVATTKAEEVAQTEEVLVKVEPVTEEKQEETKNETTTELQRENKIVAIQPIKTKTLAKQVVKQTVKPQDKERYGYPDNSLWFFYVGVFLMVLGLVFIITPALGFGVGLPFLIVGALIMMLGLLL